MWSTCSPGVATGHPSPGAPAREMMRVSGLRGRGQGGIGVLVAGTGAVSELAHGVEDLRIVDLLVLVRPEGAGVTTRASRCVGAVAPGDDLAITGVATEAANTGGMVARIVA